MLSPLLLLLGALPVSAAPPRTADTAPTLTFKQFAPGQSIRMVAYGDMRFTDPATTTGTNPRVRKWLAERIAEEHPQALLLTGDMPFVGGKDADWQNFQDETTSWRTGNILELPTIGNHENYGEPGRGIDNYLKNFPEIGGHRYYSALLGSVEVISLDPTSPSGKASLQIRWFTAQLEHIPKQVEFLIILYHFPWMADEQSQLFAGQPTRDALALRGLLESRLNRIHATVAVFNGHIHNYERFERQGVEYVVTGGGGAQPYPLLFRGKQDLYHDPGFPVFHYLTLEFGNHEMHAVMWKVKDPDAQGLSVEAKDQFTLTAQKKDGATKPDPQPRPNPQVKH